MPKINIRRGVVKALASATENPIGETLVKFSIAGKKWDEYIIFSKKTTII